jgi:PAS domain S-box-containing protein
MPNPESTGDLFDRLPVGAYRTSLDGRQLRANAAMVRLNGYDSLPELMAAVQDIAAEWYVEPGRRADFKALLERDGQVTDFVSEVHRHKTRERIWVSETAYVVRDAAGQPLYYEGTVTDVTEAVRMQQELERSERRFRRLTEKAQVLIMVCDAHAVVRYASPASQSLLGRPPESLHGHSVLSWLHPDDHAAAASEFQNVVLGRNTGGESVYRARHADGSWRHVAALGTHALDDPAIQGVVLHYRDVTEREAMLARLRAGEQRFQTAFVASPDAIVISTLAEGRVLEVNPTYLRLSGYSREELIGRTTLDMGIWDDPADRDRFLAQFQAKGHVRDFVARFKGKGDRGGMVSMSSELIDLEGESCVLAIARDVTQALADRKALEGLNAELEARVAERTRQLQDSLAEAQRMNQELQTFAYSVSHDLKAPLRALDAYSMLLAQHEPLLDEESRSHLRNIRLAARQMARLINDLLAYARIEQDVLKPQRLDLAGVVQQVLAHHAADLERLGVQPEVTVPTIEVLADPASLAMALRNLVDNALKFAALKGPPRLQIGADIQPAEAVLWVRDNGPGFDMSYHDRIFQIFQRLHRAEEAEGTGIGLALVAKAMARMGGRVWADSAPGQGATFYLALPRS